MKKIYRLEVWIFLENAPSNSVPFSSSFICATVSNASWRVKFCENVGYGGAIYPTDPLTQNMTLIVCLRWLTFNIFNYKLLSTMLNYVRQFLKIKVVLHTNELGDPQFFFFTFLTQVTHFPTAVKNFKKSIDRKIFARTSLSACAIKWLFKSKCQPKCNRSRKIDFLFFFAHK